MLRAGAFAMSGYCKMWKMLHTCLY